MKILDCIFRFPWTWCLDTPLNWELRLRDKESLPWSTVNTAPPRKRPSTSWPRAWTPTRRRIRRKRSAGKTDNSVPRILILLFMCRTDNVILEVQRQIFLNESEVECDNSSYERWNISIKLWNGVLLLQSLLDLTMHVWNQLKEIVIYWKLKTIENIPSYCMFKRQISMLNIIALRGVGALRNV